MKVIDETYDDLVYTLRIKGTRFQPKVFRDGLYTVKIGTQPDRMQTIKGVEATPKNATVITIPLGM